MGKSVFATAQGVKNPETKRVIEAVEKAQPRKHAQAQLTPEEFTSLKLLAAIRGTSVKDLMNEAVGDLLKKYKRDLGASEPRRKVKSVSTRG